jgi:hypothetical protein
MPGLRDRPGNATLVRHAKNDACFSRKDAFTHSIIKRLSPHQLSRRKGSGWNSPTQEKSLDPSDSPIFMRSAVAFCASFSE